MKVNKSGDVVISYVFDLIMKGEIPLGGKMPSTENHVKITDTGIILARSRSKYSYFSPSAEPSIYDKRIGVSGIALNNNLLYSLNGGNIYENCSFFTQGSAEIRNRGRRRSLFR